MMLPIVLPRVSGGTSVITVVINNGIMIAVPDAWITRATTSNSRPGASAAANVPSENSDIARTKTTRVCKRCSRKPVIGMTTAIVSKNAVVTHCAAAAVTPKLCMRGGIATLMIVSFKITTNAETSKSLMTRLLRTACSAPAASVVAFMGSTIASTVAVSITGNISALCSAADCPRPVEAAHCAPPRRSPPAHRVQPVAASALPRATARARTPSTRAGRASADRGP
jgi:hypothetical protein